MDGFAWAQENFNVKTPHELQSRGVNVYFAPEIPTGTKVVNLGNGHVEQFRDGEQRPASGYFANDATLAHYCREAGIPLVETNGQMSTEPTGTGEAGSPLLHGRGE